MKYFYLKLDNEKVFKLLVLFIFLLISTNSVFGQAQTTVVDNLTVIELNNNNNNNNKESATTVTTSNSMNFVLWFMGTKQGVNGSTMKENTNTKIQAITSGSAPNRLLIKAFLKKVIEADSMVS